MLQCHFVNVSSGSIQVHQDFPSPFRFLCACSLASVGFDFSKICSYISLDGCLQTFKAALSKRPDNWHCLSVLVTPGSLNPWLINIWKQNSSSSVSCWNKLWSTVETSVFLQNQPEVETVPILPLLWFLPYSCSNSFTHLPVIPKNISLINHLHANPHSQMVLRKTQHEMRHFPNSSRRGIRFLLEDIRHTVMGKNTAVSGDGVY